MNTNKQTGAIALLWKTEAPMNGYDFCGLYPDEAAAREEMARDFGGAKWTVMPVFEPEDVVNNVESEVEDVGHSIVITGNIENGFITWGPFLNREVAEEWALTVGGASSYVRHEMAQADKA
jgi:hypothetical protein